MWCEANKSNKEEELAHPLHSSSITHPRGHDVTSNSGGVVGGCASLLRCVSTAWSVFWAIRPENQPHGVRRDCATGGLFDFLFFFSLCVLRQAKILSVGKILCVGGKRKKEG
jgi:hypothetical protein